MFLESPIPPLSFSNHGGPLCCVLCVVCCVLCVVCCVSCVVCVLPAPTSWGEMMGGASSFRPRPCSSTENGSVWSAPEGTRTVLSLSHQHNTTRHHTTPHHTTPHHTTQHTSKRTFFVKQINHCCISTSLGSMNIFTVLTEIYRDTSYDKCTYWKGLFTAVKV